MKKILIILLFLFFAVPASSQVLGLLQNGTMIVIDRNSNPPFIYFNLDTTNVKNLLTHREDSLMNVFIDSVLVLIAEAGVAIDTTVLQGIVDLARAYRDTSGLGFWNWEESGVCNCNLDSLQTAILERVEDSLDIIRDKIDSTAETTRRLISMTVQDGYVTMLDSAFQEIPIADSTSVLLEANVHARSMVKDSAASYVLYATARRIGWTLEIKDTMLVILHENNPDWDVRFSTAQPDVLRLQTKGAADDIVKWTADVIITPVINADIDTLFQSFTPTMVPDLAIWLDPDTSGGGTQIEFENGLGDVVRWHSKDDSAHVWVQTDTALQYRLEYDSDRGMWGMRTDLRINSQMLNTEPIWLQAIYVVGRNDSLGTASYTVLGNWNNGTSSARGLYGAGTSPAGGWIVSLGASTDLRINDTTQVGTNPGNQGQTQVWYGARDTQLEKTWHLTVPDLGFNVHHFKGWIFEVIAFRSGLNSYHRHGIANYLLNRYNL